MPPNSQVNIYSKGSCNPFLSNAAPCQHLRKGADLVVRKVAEVHKPRKSREVLVFRRPKDQVDISRFQKRRIRFLNLHQSDKKKPFTTKKGQIEPEGQSPDFSSLDFSFFISLPKKSPRLPPQQYERRVSLSSKRRVAEFKLYKNENVLFKNIERFEDLLQQNYVDNDVDTSRSEIHKAVDKVRKDILVTLQLGCDVKGSVKRYRSVVINRVSRGVTLARDSNFV